MQIVQSNWLSYSYTFNRMQWLEFIYKIGTFCRFFFCKVTKERLDTDGQLNY